MADFTGVMVPVEAESMSWDNRPGSGYRVKIIDLHNDTTGGDMVDADGHPFTGQAVSSGGAIVIVPAVHPGSLVPAVDQRDWPDQRMETRAYTIYRAAAVAPRLKDRFYGQAARPGFLCTELVPGLRYRLTVNLEEGPIGGGFAPYTPSLTVSYLATGQQHTIYLNVPTPNQGREIRVTTYTNVRDYA